MTADAQQTNALASPWVPLSARIVGIKEEAPGISTYDLKMDDAALPGAYHFNPGQFNMLYLPGFGEAAISLSSDPSDQTTLAHTVRVVGNVTRALSEKQVRDQVLLRGPYGTSWPVVECKSNDLILACGGIGIAPLRPVIYHILNNRSDYRRVHLLYGARTPSDLLYRREYDDWRNHDIEVNVIVDIGSSDWTGDIGVVPVLVDRLRLDALHTRVFTCGPEIMMRFVILEALRKHIRSDHIFMSMERNMNCALGFCGHCQLGSEFVCKDGPVFTYERMEPYLGFKDL